MLRLNQLNANQLTCAYINDMNVLNETLKLNDLTNLFGGVLENKMTKSAKSNATSTKSTLGINVNSEYRNMLDEYEKQSEKTKNKAKLVTIVLNESNVRPRRSGKLLISRKQTTNFDSGLNEISNMFKVDYALIKRLFDLNGIQVILYILSKLFF